MLLGTRNIAAGDTRRYEIDYGDSLAKGYVLTGVTISCTSTTSTVQNASLSLDKRWVFFYATANSMQETFTVNLNVTNDNGETLNDTLIFQVDSPTIVTTATTLPLIIGPTGPAGPAGLGETGPARRPTRQDCR